MKFTCTLKLGKVKFHLIYMKKKYSLISSGTFLSEIAYNLFLTSPTLHQLTILVEPFRKV